MCLSRIYTKDTGKDTFVADNATSVINNSGVITVNTLLGDEKELKGYFISEVNLVENYIILKSKEG